MFLEWLGLSALYLLNFLAKCYLFTLPVRSVLTAYYCLIISFWFCCLVRVVVFDWSLANRSLAPRSTVTVVPVIYLVLRLFVKHNTMHIINELSITYSIYLRPSYSHSMYNVLCRRLLLLFFFMFYLSTLPNDEVMTKFSNNFR